MKVYLFIIKQIGIGLCVVFAITLFSISITTENIAAATWPIEPNPIEQFFEGSHPFNVLYPIWSVRIGMILDFLAFWFAAPEILGEQRLRAWAGFSEKFLRKFPRFVEKTINITVWYAIIFIFPLMLWMAINYTLMFLNKPLLLQEQMYNYGIYIFLAWGAIFIPVILFRDLPQFLANNPSLRMHLLQIGAYLFAPGLLFQFLSPAPFIIRLGLSWELFAFYYLIPEITGVEHGLSQKERAGWLKSGAILLTLGLLLQFVGQSTFLNKTGTGLEILAFLIGIPQILKVERGDFSSLQGVLIAGACLFTLGILVQFVATFL